MRFDGLRHRAHNPPPSPLPPSAFRPAPSLTPSPNRWFSIDRYRSTPPSATTPDSAANLSASPAANALTPKPHSAPPPPPLLSRAEYISALQARMEELERVPTSSFYHSYAGEFDVLLGEERRIVRKLTEFETSTRVENACRNRYTNILPNEPTRVRLQTLSPGDNDYINANRVSGPTGHPGYIATQAPLPDTTPHFWQMVYEAGSPLIIMLTRQHEDHCDVIKSDTYWPPAGQSVLFNDYMVQAVEERCNNERGLIERRFQVGRVVDKRRKHARDLVHADSLVPPVANADDPAFGGFGGVTLGNSTPARTRSSGGLSSGGGCSGGGGGGGGMSGGGVEAMDFDSDTEDLIRNLELIGPVAHVTQLQFLEWPDQDVPSGPGALLSMLRRADGVLRDAAKRGRRVGPPIVHCSAGVGRTGTFIAIDVTLRRLQNAFARDTASAVGVDEIRELVRQLKRQRSKMVQTAEQYKFIYLAVLEGMKRWELKAYPPFADGVNKLLPAAGESDTAAGTGAGTAREGEDGARLRTAQRTQTR